jgi:hypothetical protein
VAASSISRRISEFVGVALFAMALIWLISLVTYEPSDPVWFFTTGVSHPPANFVGRVGAFLAELSFQLFGYGAYFLPGAVGVVGLALLLVPDARCRLHEGVRRHAAPHLRQRVLQPGARQHGSGGQDVRRRRHGGRGAGPRPRGVSQSHRLHHRAADRR